MTDLDRMILAARQIGEVVEEDLLAGLYICPEYGSMWLDYAEAAMSTQDAIDLLTARVWRAVRKWSSDHGRSAKWETDRHMADVCVGWRGMYDPRSYPDLPSAVAAIHKHWKENRDA